MEYDILGIDGGTFNFKTSRGFICRSVYNENTTYSIKSNNIIEVNGVRYQIGSGKLDTEILKSKRDNLPLFLYAIANSTQHNKVKVVTGIPYYQLEKDEYIDEMKKKLIGSHDIMMNGSRRTIEVLDAKIMPEGLGAYYTLNENMNDKDVIFLDFGGSTVHIIWFKNGELVKFKSLPFGSINLLDDMCEWVLREYGGRHTRDDVADYIRRGKIGKEKCTLLKDTLDLAQPYIDNLMSMLDLEFPKDVAEYFVFGGGVEVFAESVIKNLGDVSLIRDYMFANANGFEVVGGAVYGC